MAAGVLCVLKAGLGTVLSRWLTAECPRAVDASRPVYYDTYHDKRSRPTRSNCPVSGTLLPIGRVIPVDESFLAHQAGPGCQLSQSFSLI